jgi:hypothetical protein
MTDITPIPDWTAVRQIETTDKVLGGPLPEGVANLHAQALANQNLYARKHGGTLPFLPGLTYDTGDRVKLDSGRIVASDIAGNTNDPNLDMTGWVNPASSSQIENINKFNQTTPISEIANNVADLSKIPYSGVSGKMIVRVAQYAVGIGTVGSRYYVCTSKGGIKDSYVFFELRRGVATTTGSVGGAAEFLRATSVYEGAHAWTGRHAKFAESAPGDWSEVTYTPAGYTDANKFSRSITTGVDLWKYYQVQGAGLKSISFNVPFDSNGEANLQFLATSGSASDAKIYIDDVLHKTVSLVATAAAVTRVKLKSTAGYHTVKVERPTTGVVNVFGANYSDVASAKYPTALDGFVMWHKGVMFTNQEGANDYAIVDADSGLLGGSFHGGETLLQETFVIDGVVGDPLAAITLCKNIEIRQKTKIQWSTAFLDTYSTHYFNEDGGYSLDVAFDGNITSNTFYTAMHTTPNSFTFVPYPQLIDFSILPDGFKKIDRSNLIVQEDPTSGKRVYMEMTLFNADQANIYGGPAIRKVTGSYNKVYYGPAISAPSPINITSIKSSLRKLFV